MDVHKYMDVHKSKVLHDLVQADTSDVERSEMNVGKSRLFQSIADGN